jgi:hypothetical protein
MKKSTTFHKERLLFLFNFAKISHSTHKEISLNLRATYSLNALQKTYEQKDFSLANDAETQFSSKEENEKNFFIYLSAK